MAQKRKKSWRVPVFTSLQVKYALSYLAMLAVVLVLLNTYPIMQAQELLFQSKRDSLQRQVTVMSSALMELEVLSSEKVTRVMEMLDSSGLSRVIVTDPTGLILYDNVDVVQEDNPQYILRQEVVSALEEQDVSYSRYEDGTFLSTATSPITYRGMTIGALYLHDVDREQGELLLNLMDNLRNISVVIAVIALVICTLFSQVLTRRITALLAAIRIVGEGEYGHRLNPVGNDELTHMAEEFNHLTDRLQTTEEVRRRFVSDASHELKTPLASICLLSDSILHSGDMDEELVKEFVGDIGREAERLTRITEHLLDLSRLDSLPAPERYGVDVCNVVRRVFASLAPVAEENDIMLEEDVKFRCTVGCTDDDLHQIIYNLVENAIKYNMPKGKVRVSTSYRDSEVLIEVEDTGVGIPEEDLPKVFNRFYRVDKARSRAAGGTGLGLSIVRDTVRRHGGWVDAMARTGGGTIFTVGFPKFEEVQ